MIKEAILNVSQLGMRLTLSSVTVKLVVAVAFRDVATTASAWMPNFEIMD
jgi:hypothetical protein